MNEVKNQLIIAKDLKYITKEKYDELDNLAINAHRLIKGLISSTKRLASEEERKKTNL